MTIHTRRSVEGREERKARTRQRLLDAALSLMEDGGGFSELSLRRVTRRARITPNAFYRHFDSMQDLALALLDDVGPNLRRLLRQVRKAGADGQRPPLDVVTHSVEAYMRFVQEHRRAFALIVRERAGGSAGMRAIIRRDLGYFAAELAADLRALLPGGLSLSEARALQAAELIVDLMLGVATDILDVPPDSAAAEQALREAFVGRLNMILAGALTLEGQAAKLADALRRPAEKP